MDNNITIIQQYPVGFPETLPVQGNSPFFFQILLYILYNCLNLDIRTTTADDKIVGYSGYRSNFQNGHIHGPFIFRGLHSNIYNC